MIAGEPRLLAAPPDLQGGGHGSPSRGENGADEQHQHMLPGRSGEPVTERLHSGTQPGRHRLARYCDWHRLPRIDVGGKTRQPDAIREPQPDHNRFNRRGHHMDIPVGGFAAPQPATVGQRQVLTRPDVLEHYRHLRTISTKLHTGALKFVARSTLMGQAKRLGLAAGHTLIVDNDAEMTLVFDLAIHTAKDGRSRAIDRYAKALPPPAGFDAARMLEAMRRTTFSIWKIERRHDAVGLVVTDVLREEEIWLIDVALESSGADGMLFASRFCFSASSMASP